MIKPSSTAIGAALAITAILDKFDFTPVTRGMRQEDIRMAAMVAFGNAYLRFVKIVGITEDQAREIVAQSNVNMASAYQ